MHHTNLIDCGKNEDRNDIGEGWVGTLESYKISQRERRRTTMSTTPSSMNSENSPGNLHENEQENTKSIENSPSSIHKNEQNLRLLTSKMHRNLFLFKAAWPLEPR